MPSLSSPVVRPSCTEAETLPSHARFKRFQKTPPASITHTTSALPSLRAALLFAFSLSPSMDAAVSSSPSRGPDDQISLPSAGPGLPNLAAINSQSRCRPHQIHRPGIAASSMPDPSPPSTPDQPTTTSPPPTSRPHLPHVQVAAVHGGSLARQLPPSNGIRRPRHRRTTFLQRRHLPETGGIERCRCRTPSR